MRPALVAQRAAQEVVSPLEDELARLAADVGHVGAALGIEWRVRPRR